MAQSALAHEPQDDPSNERHAEQPDSDDAYPERESQNHKRYCWHHGDTERSTPVRR